MSMKTKKPSLTPEEILARGFRATCRFRAVARFAARNAYWLEDIEEQELGEDIQKNVILITRKKDKNSFLAIRDKAILNKPLQNRTEEEKRYLNRVIGNLKCFKKFQNEVKSQLAGVACFYYYGPGRVIVRQGDPAYALYFIVTGEVTVSQNVFDPILNKTVNKPLCTMGSGMMFGEVALLHNITRTATITTNTPIVLSVFFLMKYGIKENAVGAKSVTKKAFYIKHKQLTKMALNLSVVFLGLAVIQGMSAAVVGQGINSCYLQTQQLSSQLGLAANAARLEVSSTALNNKNNIAAARQDIQLQLNALWGGANLATGPSAQICRNNLNLDLAPLDVQTLNVCYYNANVNILHSRVNQINNLKGSASQLCGACARQFPLPNQSEDLANCVSSGIENIQSQLASLQSEISSEAADLQAKSANCVQDAATNASGIISTASSNFDACIQSSST